MKYLLQTYQIEEIKNIFALSVVRKFLSGEEIEENYIVQNALKLKNKLQEVVCNGIL